MSSLSVIIPTCDRNDSLTKCLQALQEATSALFSAQPQIKCEVIVTDDNLHSTAESLIAARFPWAKCLAGPRRGPAANRNNGARKASGEWLVFVDDDCVPLANWLVAFANTIQSVDYPVLEGKTVPQGRQERADHICPSNLRGGFLWSCNFAIKRELFLELDGFDENYPFPLMEDVDLLFRIRKNGLAPKFVPDAVVEHPWRTNGGMDYVRKRAMSLKYFLGKHPQTEPMFLRSWGFWRVIRIIAFEFPQNILRFGNKGSFRVLYLDLWFASCVLSMRIGARVSMLRSLLQKATESRFAG